MANQTTRRDRDVVGVPARGVPIGSAREHAPVTTGHGNRISANVGKGHGNQQKSGTANRK